MVVDDCGQIGEHDHIAEGDTDSVEDHTHDVSGATVAAIATVDPASDAGRKAVATLGLAGSPAGTRYGPAARVDPSPAARTIKRISIQSTVSQSPPIPT